MQSTIANLVYPVFDYGLALRERLERGESPTIGIEQATLKGMLLSDSEARRWAAYGGDAELRGTGESRGRGGPSFLGIRYALTCWLDEIFILDSTFAAAWNERKLEVAFYGTNDRAWKFWDQARVAEGRGGTDALEVFFLCVMLGFRGELREEPEQLHAWTAAARAQLARGHGQEWPHPPELEAPSDVPPLQGQENFRRMITIAAILIPLLIPILFFVL